MISQCKWLLGMPDWHTKQSLTQTNRTRWCINTIRSPDDEHRDAWNMQRDEINKYTKKYVKYVISKNTTILWNPGNYFLNKVASHPQKPDFSQTLLWHLKSQRQDYVLHNNEIIHTQAAQGQMESGGQQSRH